MELSAAKEKQRTINNSKINADAWMMCYQWIVNNKGIIVAGHIEKRKQTHQSTNCFVIIRYSSNV